MPPMPPIPRTLFQLARLAPVLVLLAACASGRREDAAVFADLEKAVRDAEKPQTRTAVLIAINDVYRIEGVEGGKVGGLARLRALRQELEEDHPDLLLLHGGDFLFPSFASRMYKGEQMIDVLNALDGNAGADDDRMIAVVGNHEFEDKKLADAARLDQRIEASQFRWLAGNVMFKPGGDGQPLVADDRLARHLDRRERRHPHRRLRRHRPHSQHRVRGALRRPRRPGARADGRAPRSRAPSWWSASPTSTRRTTAGCSKSSAQRDRTWSSAATTTRRWPPRWAGAGS